MLRREVDPELCCFEESTIWENICPEQSPRSSHYSVGHLMRHGKHFFEHIELYGNDRESPADSGTYFVSEDDEKPWGVRHSLELIMKDMCNKVRPEPTAKLLDLVAEKRAGKIAIDKQVRKQPAGGKRGRKQKQRNKKKGKGKRGTIAQADEDSIDRELEGQQELQ